MNETPNTTNKYILPALVILLLAGSAYYLATSSSTEDAADSAVSTVKENTLEVMENVENAMMDKMEAPEGSMVYNVTDASASYTAQKRFLEKEDDVVTGVTTDVNGEGWFDGTTGAMYLNINANLSALETGTKGRDSDVASMFVPETAIFMLKQDESDIALGVEFTQEITGTLIVNNIEKEVAFNVTGTVTDSGFTATGTSTVLMSDFGINPPSLAGVYTVDDEIVLNFTVEAEKVEDVMMEDDTEAMDGEDKMMESDQEMVEDDTTMMEDDSAMEETN